MIEFLEDERVAILRIADGKANTLSLDSCRAMIDRLGEVEQSPARAVVVTASGRIFSAGVDLVRLLDGGPPYIREFLPVLSRMLTAVFSHPKPVVAAINGHAIAGGCVLASAADRRLMARDAGRIGVTELIVGVPFPAVAMEIMRCANVPRYFDDTLFSGATYEPEEAKTRGLIDTIVEPVHLLERAMVTARTLAALPPTAFALTKRQIRQPAFERLERLGRSIDAAVEDIWSAPETLKRIREYVARTLHKGR